MFDPIAHSAHRAARESTQRALNALDMIEQPAPTARSAGDAWLDLSPKDLQRYSIGTAVRSMLDPYDPRLNGIEREASDAIAVRLLGDSMTSRFFVPQDVLQMPLGVRAMATVPGAKGGYASQAEPLSFVDILRKRSVAISLGAMVEGGLMSTVALPRISGSATMSWQAGEGVSVAATDQTMGLLSMTPKMALALTDTSEQLLRQGPIAERVFMTDLASVVGTGLDAAVINGPGGEQPIGIKNTIGITSSQDAASATLAKILAFGSTAGTANAVGINPGFVTNTAGAVVLQQKFTNSTGSPALWVGNSFDGQLVGFRAMSSEQVPSGNLIFGSAWESILIGEWGVLELAASRSGTGRFDKAIVTIRAMWMVDVLVRYPSAFVVATNLS